MMEMILASAILSLSTNLDNLVVGMALGVKKLNIRLPANLLIAVLSGTSTYASMWLGDWIDSFLSPHLAQLSSSGLLVAIGALMLAEVWQSQGETSWESDRDGIFADVLSLSEGGMGLKEAGFLGLMLTISNLGTGISAGMAQLDLGLTSCCSFLTSLLTIGGGAILGKIVTQQIESDRLALLAGCLLMGLGIYEAF